MPTQLSPGVAVVEKDFSSIVPAVSSSAGAYAGAFSWGPIEFPIRLSSENELVAKFGAPTDSNYQSFFSAANFLAYANTMYVNRIDAVGLKNATSTVSGGLAGVTVTNQGLGYTSATPPAVTVSAPNIAGGVQATVTITMTSYDDNGTTKYKVGTAVVSNAGSGYTATPTITVAPPAAGTTAVLTPAATVVGGVKIKNSNHYLENFSEGVEEFGTFAAKYSGTRANGVRVYLVDRGNWETIPADVKALLPGQPGTSDFAARNIGPNVYDELHVVVIDNGRGSFSGVPGSVLEKFEYLSKITDAQRSDGTNFYYKTYINQNSSYLWTLEHPTDTEDEDVSSSVVSAGLVSFVTAGSKITCAAVGEFTGLANLKTYLDNAHTPVEIVVTGSASNNGQYTVTAVNAIPVSQLDPTIASYEILVSTAVVNENNVSCNIDRKMKVNWGVPASAFTAVIGSKSMDVMGEGTAGQYTLNGGADDFTVGDSPLQNAYAMFANVDDYDVSLIVAGNVSATTANNIISNVAEVRKDCMVFISPRNTSGNPWITSTQAGDAVTAAVTYKNSVNTSSSFAVIDSGWKYQYDRYNDKYRWVTLNADTAGLCARTDLTADTWYSPGGFNRGQIKNVVKLGYNPNQSQRDELYKNGINPVVTFPGQGTVLYGDKTMLAKPSAFDRINVRRLFIVLEKAIATAAKYQLFEFNDSFTRAQFRNLIEPFLRDVQGRRGIVDFKVVCDETNNTGEVIDRNEFVADIFIKPNRSINFITLTFVAARSSVSFEEIGA